MYGGPFSSSQDYTPGRMLWDKGCLSEHSRWQVSALVKAGLVIISLLLVMYAFRKTLYFYFLHGKLNMYDDDDKSAQNADVSFFDLRFHIQKSAAFKTTTPS